MRAMKLGLSMLFFGLALLVLGCKDTVEAPTGLIYSTNPASYVVGTTIPSNTPTHSGGRIDSYSVSPALPPGLALNSSTGVITGTPTTVTAQASYSVKGANSAGSTTATLTISVDAKPPSITITTQPANQVVTVGQQATFSVVATGTGPLTYQWSKGGTDIPGATSASYTTPATVLGDSSSTFTVLITNTDTSDTLTSQAATLTVNPAAGPITIKTQPADQSISVGQTATFSVVATGTGPLTYQWSKNGVAIPGATSASYTTPAAILADSGSTFSVLITNTTSSDTLASSSATLTVVASGGPGTSIATGGMATTRDSHTATLLPNGKVLIAGGYNGTALGTAELYDPTAGTFTTTGGLTTPRYSHTATLLANGKVLIAGGYTPTGVTASAELYDPAAGTFSSAGTMLTGRSEHTATLLSGGKVLLAAGRSAAVYLNTAELYDPNAATFTATAHPMVAARIDHTASLLGNGQVLITGGQTAGLLSSVELYDPAGDTFTLTGSLSMPRTYHTATVLPNGKVLVVGGALTSVAEVYDPTAGIFSATAGNLVLQRDRLNGAILLPTGKVLISGGVGNGAALSANELYDPANGTFTSTGSMTTARRLHTLTLLSGGKVLIAGGLGGTFLSSAELYY